MSMIENAFRDVERRKVSLGLPQQETPSILNAIRWKCDRISGKELLSLQRYVGVVTDPVEATSKIFLQTDTTDVAGIADNLEYLRSHGDDETVAWLSQINEALSDMVERDCPPLFILVSPFLVYGHLLDGNHRAVMAGIKALKGQDISLPVYRGEIDTKTFAALNARHLRDALKRNFSLTVRVAARRLRKN